MDNPPLFNCSVKSLDTLSPYASSSSYRAWFVKYFRVKKHATTMTLCFRGSSNWIRSSVSYVVILTHSLGDRPWDAVDYQFFGGFRNRLFWLPGRLDRSSCQVTNLTNLTNSGFFLSEGRNQIFRSRIRTHDFLAMKPTSYHWAMRLSGGSVVVISCINSKISSSGFLAPVDTDWLQVDTVDTDILTLNDRLNFPGFWQTDNRTRKSYSNRK